MERFKNLSSIEDVSKLTVKELKEVLSYHEEAVGGKKADLVLRCCALFSANLRSQVKDDEDTNKETSAEQITQKI